MGELMARGWRSCAIFPRSFVRVMWVVVLSSAHVSYAEVVLSPLQIDTRLSLGFVDNVGQAQRKRDTREDEFAELEVGAGYQTTLFNGRLDASGRGFLTAREHFDVDGLSHWGGGAELGLDWRLTNSPLPPFARLSLRIEGEEYDFKQRDSNVFTGGVEIGANFGPRTVLSAGGEYRDRQSRSKVFDLEQWSGFLNAKVDLGDVWQLGARAEYIDGDVWSSVQVVPPDGPPVDDIFNLIAAASIIQRDDAFNDAFDGDWFVYRLPAKRQEYSVSLSRALGNRLAVSFEWLEVRVQGERNNDYDNRVLQLSLGFQL